MVGRPKRQARKRQQQPMRSSEELIEAFNTFLDGGGENKREIEEAVAKELAQPFNPRSLWRPKLPALKEQCATCPFRDTDGFAAIAEKLCDKAGEPFEGDETVERARLMIHQEATHMGDFACHHTAYDENLDLRPRDEHRQCPGATAHFVAAGVELMKKRRT